MFHVLRNMFLNTAVVPCQQSREWGKKLGITGVGGGRAAAFDPGRKRRCSLLLLLLYFNWKAAHALSDYCAVSTTSDSDIIATFVPNM